MKIAIIGYGKMGKLVKELADQRDIAVVVIEEGMELSADLLKGAICIDFTNAAAFLGNYRALADYGAAVVVGTTGWDMERVKVCDYFKSQNKTLIYGSNFSLGANLHFKIVNYAAALLAKAEYDPYLIEMHHRSKKDAPSGTAKQLAQILDSHFKGQTTPLAVRCGAIRGVHEVGFESMSDHLRITHEAYDRSGFAEGALLAAKWASEVVGVWEFSDLLAHKWQLD